MKIKYTILLITILIITCKGNKSEPDTHEIKRTLENYSVESTDNIESGKTSKEDIELTVEMVQEDMETFYSTINHLFFMNLDDKLTPLVDKKISTGFKLNWKQHKSIKIKFNYPIHKLAGFYITTGCLTTLTQYHDYAKIKKLSYKAFGHTKWNKDTLIAEGQSSTHDATPDTIYFGGFETPEAYEDYEYFSLELNITQIHKGIKRPDILCISELFPEIADHLR